MRVAAFDFDGVLAIPYSNPEHLYPDAEKILRELHAAGVTVVVASFNPRSYWVLKRLLDEGVIAAIRAGSLTEWWKEGDGVYHDTLHRTDMDKSLHLRDMLAKELQGRGPVDSITFFDDDMANITDVLAGTYGEGVRVEAIHVQWYAGAGRATLRCSEFLANEF